MSKRVASGKRWSSHRIRLASGRLDGEFGRVGAIADRDPVLVVGEVIDPVGNGPSELSVDEVVRAHPRRLARRVPLGPGVPELPDKFLLLRADADDRLVEFTKAIAGSLR